MGNKSLGVQALYFRAQISPKFVCLMATAIQWHLHIYVAAGKAEQALLISLKHSGGKWASQWRRLNYWPSQR